MLSSFISRVKRHNVALNSRFVVTISPPPFMRTGMNADQQNTIELFCEQSMFPEMALATVTLKDYGVNREVVYDKLYGQISLTFLCDEEMYIKRFFDLWIDTIAKYKGGIFAYPADYTSAVITVSQLDRAWNKTYTVAMHSVYPKVVNDVVLNASGKDVNRFTVVFTHENWESFQIAPKNLRTPIADFNSRKLQNISVPSNPIVSTEPNPDIYGTDPFVGPPIPTSADPSIEVVPPPDSSILPTAINDAKNFITGSSVYKAIDKSASVVKDLLTSNVSLPTSLPSFGDISVPLPEVEVPAIPSLGSLPTIPSLPDIIPLP